MLIGRVFGFGAQKDGGAIDSGDMNTAAAAQGERKRSPDQAEADDGDALHPRMAWPIPRSFARQRYGVAPAQRGRNARHLTGAADPGAQDDAIGAGRDGGARDRFYVASPLRDAGHVDDDRQVGALLGSSDGRDLQRARAVGIFSAGFEQARCCCRPEPARVRPRRSRRWRPSCGRAPRNERRSAGQKAADGRTDKPTRQSCRQREASA